MELLTSTQKKMQQNRTHVLEVENGLFSEKFLVFTGMLLAWVLNPQLVRPRPAPLETEDNVMSLLVFK